MSVYVPAELRRQVRGHFANCCGYCRTAENLTVAIFEFEHIVPRSAGGETIFENICFACPTCNRYKSDRTVAVDPETQNKVALFHPHRDAWAEHFTWNDDATELVAQTATGRATIAALMMNRPQLIRVRRMWMAMDEHPPDFGQPARWMRSQRMLPSSVDQNKPDTAKTIQKLSGLSPGKPAHRMLTTHS